MKRLLKPILDDYKKENYSIMQWILSALFVVLAFAACAFAEWMSGKW